MKILSVADIHITLHKEKIPYEWQINRFKELFEKLLELEKECDVTVIAGDIFDKKPELDEIALFLTYANRVTKPTLAIPGNHEASAKGETFLEHFTKEHTINNSNFRLYTKNAREVINGQGFQLFPYGEMQIGNVPKYVENDILITHIRGEVPPHITAEFDFDKLKDWKLVLLGDLHFRHKYKDYPIYYPGSPLNTKFDRDDTRDYGVDIIYLLDINNYSVVFQNLDLPKLVRKTVNAGDALVEHKKHHVIYEVKGSIDVLSKISNHKLLDKKIADTPNSSSKLELKELSIKEEIISYLNYIKIEEDRIPKVLQVMDELGIK